MVPEIIEKDSEGFRGKKDLIHIEHILWDNCGFVWNTGKLHFQKQEQFGSSVCSFEDLWILGYTHLFLSSCCLQAL